MLLSSWFNPFGVTVSSFIIQKSYIYLLIFKRSFDLKGDSKGALKDYKDYRRTTSKSTVLDTKVSIYIDR